MSGSKTYYEVFNTSTGLHDRVDTWEEAVSLRQSFLESLVDRIFHSFTIVRIEENEDGSSSMVPVDVSHMTFQISTANATDTPKLNITENS